MPSTRYFHGLFRGADGSQAFLNCRWAGGQRLCGRCVWLVGVTGPVAVSYAEPWLRVPRCVWGQLRWLGVRRLPGVGDEVSYDAEGLTRAVVTDIRRCVYYLRAPGRGEWAVMDPGLLRVTRTRDERLVQERPFFF